VSLFKDFRARKEIDNKAVQLVGDCFTTMAMKKILAQDEKKAEKKIASKLQSLKLAAHKYITDNKLGVYGKARLLREIQNQLLQYNFNSDLVDAILGDFLVEPLKK